ncbi:unnamed protein product [Schistosoma turkestanicum]|nr:unnamed protein product [Schistosoma turkestanicum]
MIFTNRRTVRAQNWSDGYFLDILHEPSKVTHTVLGEQLGCELIPYEVMERWVVFGYLLIYPELTDEESFNRLKVALRHSYVVVLFREEVIYIHSLLQSFLESSWVNKVGAKRINEIKETFSIACSQTPKMHADRRAYLRLSLRQLHLILSDEPDINWGPKPFLHQLRFTIVFPSICSQAVQSCHDLCPEERSHIGRNAVNMCRHFLSRNLLINICLYLFNRIDEFG